LGITHKSFNPVSPGFWGYDIGVDVDVENPGREPAGAGEERTQRN